MAIYLQTLLRLCFDYRRFFHQKVASSIGKMQAYVYYADGELSAAQVEARLEQAGFARVVPGTTSKGMVCVAYDNGKGPVADFYAPLHPVSGLLMCLLARF